MTVEQDIAQIRTEMAVLRQPPQVTQALEAVLRHIRNHDEIVVGTATPTHVAEEATLFWDKTNDKLYVNSGGSSWTEITGGSGDVATDVIWDAKGDLPGGTGADTAARLAVGTNDQVLTAASGETTGMKWAAAGGHNEAHGISAHTEHATHKVLYTDASGDEQELALGAAGTVLRGRGTTTAPDFAAVDLAADVTGDLPVAEGGTGASTAQAAIDTLSAVSGATNEHVLTKDTGSGNAIFKAAAGGGSGSMTTVKHDGSQVGGADIVTLDFGDGIAITETPDTEINVSLEAATTSNVGGVALATAAETTAGTEADKAVTPDGFAGSDHGIRYVALAIGDKDTDLATGNGQASFQIPAGLDGMNLVQVLACLDVVGTTGTIDIQIRRSRETSPTAVTDVDMLSTKITIDTTEFSSHNAAVAAVINTSNDDINKETDRIFADIDAVHTTQGKKLTVTLGFQKP